MPADTVVWLREQHWFTGTFAHHRPVLPQLQWALLADRHRNWQPAVISVGPHDFHASSWGARSFSFGDFSAGPGRGWPIRKRPRFGGWPIRPRGSPVAHTYKACR